MYFSLNSKIDQLHLVLIVHHLAAGEDFVGVAEVAESIVAQVADFEAENVLAHHKRHHPARSRVHDLEKRKEKDN